MLEAIINVAGVFQPKPGKKRGVVKSVAGVAYGAMPPILAQVNQGGTYKIAYDDDEFNGVVYHVIKKVEPVSGQPNVGSTQAPAAAPSTSPAPQYSVDPVPERIFVCGALNALLSNPTTSISDIKSENIIEIVKGLRRAWTATFGGGRDDMNDSIPF